MGTSRFLCVGLVLITFITWQSASAAEIGMPLGSTVWMAFNSSVPPIDQQDVAGSNLPGLAPPNGIPLTTVTDATRFSTGYTEVLPDRIRTLGIGNSPFVYAAFQDTYTVSGAAAGPFDIPFQLHVTGTARTIPLSIPGTHAFLTGGLQARIGTFVPDSFINESFRVSPFDFTTANPNFTVPNMVLAAPGSAPIDFTASYIKTSVNIGDVFNIAYQVFHAAGIGEIDLANDGGGSFISFTLPEGVFLTSAMAQALPAPGNVRITGNDRVNDGITRIDLPAGMTVPGTLEITDNPLVEHITIAVGTTADEMVVTDNSGAQTISLGGGAAAGELTIMDNGNATINLAGLVTVTGEVTLETTGEGTADFTDLTAGGNSDITTDGYTTVESNTAAGQTALTMINSEATMELVLPAGTFPQGNPVQFSVESLEGGTVEMMGDATVTHLVSYRFNFDVPTLGDAELNFEIDLRVMDEMSRLALLGLLDMDAVLTLAVRGDEPGAELNLFDVCAPGTALITDECVRVLWLDQNGAMLDPLGAIDPTVLRFEGLVGHFSTYSVVAFLSSESIPEPASLALLGVGAAVLLRRPRRQGV